MLEVALEGLHSPLNIYPEADSNRHSPCIAIGIELVTQIVIGISMTIAFEYVSGHSSSQKSGLKHLCQIWFSQRDGSSAESGVWDDNLCIVIAQKIRDG